MKHSTTNTLITAKAIYNETKHLINSGDKHACTAGIILLQDCVELIVLAVLDELDLDEQRSLESKSFNELLGELKRNSVPVIKSGTIKALNKQRVISKHYGQLAEPASVVNYFKTAELFIDSVLSHVIGKPLNEIFLVDIVSDCPAKKHLQTALALSEEKDYLSALIEVRKAFFVSYEYEYSVYAWRNTEKKANGMLGLLLGLGLEGIKAHYWNAGRP